MQPTRRAPALDLYPIAAFLGFWFVAGLLSALGTGEPRLVGLGVVTLPAVVAVLVAARRVRQASRRTDALSPGPPTTRSTRRPWPAAG